MVRLDEGDRLSGVAAHDGGPHRGSREADARVVLAADDGRIGQARSQRVEPGAVALSPVDADPRPVYRGGRRRSLHRRAQVGDRVLQPEMLPHVRFADQGHPCPEKLHEFH